MTVEISPLSAVPPQFQGNYILYRLAEALGYTSREGNVETGRIIDADPDRVLDEALDAIWRYTELNR